MGWVCKKLVFDDINLRSNSKALIRYANIEIFHLKT